MKTLQHLLLFALVLLSSVAAAETADQRRLRIERLEHAVFAPCCYKETVAAHPSDIATKMQLEITKWVEMGKSDQEILSAYVGLYGREVLVDPRTIPSWWTPWVPLITLIPGTALVLWILKRWRSGAQARRPESGSEGVPLPVIDEDDLAF